MRNSQCDSVSNRSSGRFSDSVRLSGRCRDSNRVDKTSRDRMEQTPGHGSHLIEELEGDTRLCRVNSTDVGQQAKESIDLFGRAIGDSPVVKSISTRPTVAFAEIGRNGACGPYHLIGK